MYADLLVPRLLLELKRHRANKKGRSTPKLPKIIVDQPLSGFEERMKNPDEYEIEVEILNYPPLMSMIVFEPPGLVAGIKRSGDLTSVAILTQRIEKMWVKTYDRFDTLTSSNHTDFSKTLAKIAYAHAVLELGLDAFEASDIIDLLCERRDDTYNFVGGYVGDMRLTTGCLHRLYTHRRGDLVCVIVHLFAAYGMPAYEVVVGRIMHQ